MVLGGGRRSNTVSERCPLSSRTLTGEQIPNQAIQSVHMFHNSVT